MSVTWLGHATTSIELGGQRVLTDPVLTDHVAHLSRIGCGAPSRTATAADVAVISHLHLDHLHVPSLRRLDLDVRIVAPRGTVRVIARSDRDLSRRVEEVVAGDVVEIGGLTLRAVPAAHDGRRTPLSRYSSSALGFVIEPASEVIGPRVWFAGDTGLFEAMDGIGPVDVALVPIGGWGPGLGPDHLDPVEAAEAVRRVSALDALPIHYGTFWPTGLRHIRRAEFRRQFLEPGWRFAEALRAGFPGATAHVVDVGETATIQTGPRPVSSW